MGNIEAIMNKPVYLDQAILDLSKLIMYKIHHDYVVLKNGSRAKLCCMNTYSLVYLIKTEDFYANVTGDVMERFNISGYDKADDRPLPVGVDKKAIRLMKGELGGKIMTDVVALRPKSYAYKKQDNTEGKKCKGINKCVVKHTISSDDYKDCLFNSESRNTYRLQLMFRNAKHEIHTVEVNKVALNRNDNKQIIKKDGISMLMRGHYSIGWNPTLGFVSLSWNLVMSSLQNYLIISQMLRSHYQTSVLTLFYLLLDTC